jgi:hypothetical protein
VYSSLTALLDSICNLVQLLNVDVGRCSSLEALPDSIGNLGQLQWLNLSRCDSLVAGPVMLMWVDVKW